MKCEICGTEYRKIESSLICSNGHTLQNTQEVAHEDAKAMALKTKRIRKAKPPKKMFIGTGCKLTTMVLMKILFEEAKEFFKFPNDKIFKYFTYFFEFKKTKLETPLELTKNQVFILIYLNRRSIMEKQGIPYLVTDCIRDFRELDIYTRIIVIKNKYPSLEAPCYEFSKTSYLITILNLKRMIRDLTDHYSCPIFYTTTKYSDSGVLLDSIEKAKHNIRGMIRNDLEMSKKYFKIICEKYNIKITKSLNLYFEKFIYTFDNNQIFIPEYDFALFISAYFIEKKKFEDTELESAILTNFGCSKVTFIKTMYDFFKRLDLCLTPEVFIKEMKKKNKKRFEPLKRSIEFIDAFKRNLTCKTRLGD